MKVESTDGTRETNQVFALLAAAMDSDTQAIVSKYRVGWDAESSRMLTEEGQESHAQISAHLAMNHTTFSVADLKRLNDWPSPRRLSCAWHGARAREMMCCTAQPVHTSRRAPRSAAAFDHWPWPMTSMPDDISSRTMWIYGSSS